MELKYELFHGDCIEYMRRVRNDSFDLVFTDPPYPKLKGGVNHLRGGVAEQLNQHITVGDMWSANLDWVSAACRVTRYGIVCFCSYHSVSMFYDEFVKNGLIVRGLGTWYKRNSPNPVNNVPKFTTEFFWMFQKSPGLNWRNVETMIDEPMPSAGCFAVERILMPGTKVAAHPTQKPIKLIKSILEIGGSSVFDPFMGTGTTGHACADMGRRFVGCELYPLQGKPIHPEENPDHFGIAQSRIEKAYRRANGLPKLGKETDTLDLPLFA